MENRDKITAKDIHVDDKGVLRYQRLVNEKGLEESEAGVGMELIGFDQNGDLLAVGGWDWSIFKIKSPEIEQLGRLERTLATIKKNPKILLEEAKVMSLDEIEKQLGHKVIVRDKNGFYI